jgi:hypothetical protein
MAVHEKTNNLEIFDNIVKISDEYSARSDSYIFLNKFKHEYYIIVNNYNESGKFTDLYYQENHDPIYKDKNRHAKVFHGYNNPISRVRGLFELNILLTDEYSQVYYDGSANDDESRFKLQNRTDYLRSLTDTNTQYGDISIPDYTIYDTEMKETVVEIKRFSIGGKVIETNTGDYIVKTINEFFKDYPNLDTSDRHAFFQRFQHLDSDTIYQTIREYFRAVFNDDSSNIDNINRDSIKAELVIIDYLRKKQNIVEKLYHFLIDYKFFDYYDPSKKIFFELIQLLEKLTFAIKLREYENYIIQTDITLQQRDPFLYNLNNVSRQFFESVYLDAREKYKDYTRNDRTVNKQLIYSKVSYIQIYLDSIVDVYNVYMKNINLNSKDKLLLCHSMIILFNNVLSEIVKLDKDEYILSKLHDSDKSQSWLIKVEYLNTLVMIYEYYIISGSISESINIHSYIDKVLYLFVYYYGQDRRGLFERSKVLLEKLIHIKPEKTLDIAISYRDFHTMTHICYYYNYSGNLTTNMENYSSNESIIEYIIKLYLSLESNNLRQNSQKGFACFEIFYEKYNPQLQKVIAKYPKLKALYDTFLTSKSKNYHIMSTSVEELTKSTNNDKVKSLMLRIYRIVNSNFLVNYNTLDEANITYTNLAKQACDEVNYAILMDHLKYAFKIGATDDFSESLRQLVSDMNRLESKESPKVKYHIVLFFVNLYKEIARSHGGSISTELEIDIIRSIVYDEYAIFSTILSKHGARSVSNDLIIF